MQESEIKVSGTVNYGAIKALNEGYQQGSLCDQNHVVVETDEDEPPPAKYPRGVDVGRQAKLD